MVLRFYKERASNIGFPVFTQQRRKKAGRGMDPPGFVYRAYFVLMRVRIFPIGRANNSRNTTLDAA